MIDFEKISFKEPVDDVMLHYRTCSDIQLVLQTDNFVDRTFWQSN